MMQSLSAVRLKAMLDQGDDVQLIDVLPRVSFDKQHIPGALHASFYDDDFLERVEALVDDKESTVVVYCVSASCNASAKAARKLVDAGYTNVLDFEGGVREWAEAGFALRCGPTSAR
jgi:rhodanese-related sulfurtransferase